MARKLTTEEIIKRFREVHGNKYDYSLVEYINNRTKIKIICKEHGEFTQIPASHLSGSGCYDCGKIKRIQKITKPQNEIIKHFEKVHGDKYDYSLVEYKGDKKHVKIICPIHGEFKQTPANHKKYGCNECGTVEANLKNTKNTEQFIKDAKMIHGDKYDYSLVNYKGTSTQIKIICSKHGEFKQTPVNHLSGSGCYDCGNIESSKKRTKSTTQFIKDAKKLHGNKYDYSLVEYKSSTKKIKIICPIHGEFKQKASNHLSGNGCNECGIVNMGKYHLKSINQFIKDAKLVHGEKYDYSLVEYINGRTNIKIICPIHGEFEQTPVNHLSRNGCPKCNTSKGNFKISSILDNNNITYIDEHRYDDCRNTYPLPFDFYLPYYNMCVEYDGKQHFNIVEYFGGEKGFKQRQINDKTKNKYCKDNNIGLIRIPYWDFDNIEEILKNELELTKKTR